VSLPSWFPRAWRLLGIALAGYAAFDLTGWLGTVLVLGVLMYAQATVLELEQSIVLRLRQPVQVRVHYGPDRTNEDTE